MTSYDTAVLADSPLAYWKLDELTGASTFADSSGNGRSLTKSGTVTFSQPPPGIVPGTAISLAGSGGGYVAAPAYFTSLTVFTVEFWAKWTSASYMVIAAHDNSGNSPSSPTRAFQVYATSAGQLQCEAYNNLGNNADTAPARVVNDGAWHHCVFVFNAGAMSLYIDGALDGTATLTATINTGAGTSWFSIGGNNNAAPVNNGDFTGSLDSVALYGTALTATQIATHYRAGNGGTYAAVVRADSPFAYWPLNETTGTTSFDSSGNARHGTYSGGFTLLSDTTFRGSTVAFDCTNGAMTVGAGSDTWQFSSWTLECWAYFTTIPSSDNPHVLMTLSFPGTGPLNMAMGFDLKGPGVGDATKLSGGLYNGAWKAAVSSAGLSTSNWHHLVVTWSSAFARIYIDGVFIVDSGNTGSGTTTPTTNPDFRLARRWDASGSDIYTPVSMQHAAVYPTALSSTQIAAHYVAGVQPQSTIRVAHRGTAISRASTR